jgi:endogenous inhibitor of DNA gyrase (YacG/DUF329 family)
MNKQIINIEQFNDAKCGDLIDIRCADCQQQFQRKKAFIKTSLRRGVNVLRCPKCHVLSRIVPTTIKICVECKKEFECRRYVKNRFCSKQCAIVFNARKKRRAVRNCPTCGNIIKGYRYKKHCSKKCMDVAKHNEYVQQWLNGKILGYYPDTNHSVKPFVRRFLFEKFDSKCQRCGWSEKNQFTDKVPLTVHHKDGNSTNTVLENLELLCPNCHSLTETYGAGNKGNSRRHYKKVLRV